MKVFKYRNLLIK